MSNVKNKDLTPFYPFGYSAGAVIAAGVVTGIALEEFLGIFDEIFETQGSYFSSEEYLLRLRESRWKGEAYINKLLKESEQAMSDTDNLLERERRRRLPCKK